MLYFQSGQIVHAEAGASAGLDALSEICYFSDANFAFQEGEVASKQTLGVYPTPKLIEKIRQQVEEVRTMHEATPDFGDVPVYNQSASLAGLEATPDDLALLLLCSGGRTVSEIAHQVNRSPADTAKIVAKFHRAKIVELHKPEPPPAQAPESDAGRADPQGGSPRYWRGKLVE